MTDLPPWEPDDPRIAQAELDREDPLRLEEETLRAERSYERYLDQLRGG